jgi:hypothetical protein
MRMYFDCYRILHLVPSPPDKQSMDDNHSETEDTLDQVWKFKCIEKEKYLF